MQLPAKSVSCAPSLLPPPADEIGAQSLLARLSMHRTTPLVFRYEGKDVLPGYHVTEVKDGFFNALDCGANPEAWRETFIQLWDVPAEDGQIPMTAGKFLAIMAKVGQHVPMDAAARLTFEVSDGIEAMRLYRAETIDSENGRILVTLSSRPASCKPRDRQWLEQQSAVSATGSSCESKPACCS